jgi:hypothetical protein
MQGPYVKLNLKHWTEIYDQTLLQKRIFALPLLQNC